MMSALYQRFTLTAVAALAVLSVASVSAETPVSVDATGEFPAETAAIVTATAALFDAVESPAPTEPRKPPVIRLPRLATKARVEPDAKTGPLTEKGPVRHLTGYRISWYPVDRFLGTVDFMGTWDGNRNLVCGYVTWDLSDPEAPVLDTVAANYVDLKAISGEPASRIHAALLEANCAYGAIDANFTLFEVAG